MIQFTCPKCDASLKSPNHKIGRISECPKCGTELVIPAVDGVGIVYAPIKKEPVEISFDPDIHGAKQEDYAEAVQNAKLITGSRFNNLLNADPSLGFLIADIVIEIIFWCSYWNFHDLRNQIINKFDRHASIAQSLLLLIFLSAAIFMKIVLLRITLRDARSRGLFGIEMFWIFILVNVNAALGWWVYASARPLGPLASCKDCGHLRLKNLKRCPHCGIRNRDS
ncbi:hypothetical protein KIH39_26370 [Telmatocola sphagniphila]|uniref:Uncharacterized protein n=1 Tax=Telmatocola sphagniphila TaxID=1123043 RepID=A0A8E6B8F2_9BACT|nr:hypothetical protein [Telmatocola sphagniphila]QVL32315.1 hypothetical protein KIH39_26370 [Telmatocola sphagniphila]